MQDTNTYSVVDEKVCRRQPSGQPLLPAAQEVCMSANPLSLKICLSDSVRTCCCCVCRFMAPAHWGGMISMSIGMGGGGAMEGTSTRFGHGITINRIICGRSNSVRTLCCACTIMASANCCDVSIHERQQEVEYFG
jgi:hypothetical protein